MALVLLLTAATGVLYGAMSFRWGSPPPPPQLDSLLYYRYARALADGHAYRLDARDEPSTGSTSHLYPAVLALLGGRRAAGAGWAGFLSGVVLMGFTLLAVVAIARKIEPDAAGLAVCLVGLSGHTACAVFGQSDMSLFIPLALGAWAAALHGRAVWLGVLLTLCVFCRPEGMILAAGMAVMAGGAWLGRGFRCPAFAVGAKSAGATAGGQVSGVREEGEHIECRISNTEFRSGRLVWAGVAGVVAAVVVLGLNWALTGSAMFQSVMGKGYFHELPWAAALWRAAVDFAGMVGGILVGVGGDRSRALYLLPVTGGVLFAAGLLLRGRGREERGSRVAEWWFLAAVVLSMGLIAAGGYAGVAHDRYLGWILPVVILYAAVGLTRAAVRFERIRRLRLWLVALLVLYQVAGSVYFLRAFSADTRRMAGIARFVEEVHRQLPPEASVGMVGRSGLAWYMPGRRVVNVSGIGSPALIRGRSDGGSLEQLRRRPELRFDYWLVYPADPDSLWIQPFRGTLVSREFGTSAVGPLSLYRAEWSPWDKPERAAGGM